MWSSIWDAVSGLGGLFGGEANPNALGWLSLLGTGAGVGSQVYGAVQQHNAAEDLKRAANRQINPYEFYNQMSEAERQAMQRQIKADMATRGIPFDSGYATGLTAEIMAGRESDRFNNALNASLANRQMQLGAFGDRGRLMQGMPQVGDQNALGNYMQWRAARMGRQSGQGQTLGAQGGSNSGSAAQPSATMNWGDTTQEGWSNPGSTYSFGRGAGNINPYAGSEDMYGV